MEPEKDGGGTGGKHMANIPAHVLAQAPVPQKGSMTSIAGVT